MYSVPSITLVDVAVDKVGAVACGAYDDSGMYVDGGASDAATLRILNALGIHSNSTVISCAGMFAIVSNTISAIAVNFLHN